MTAEEYLKENCCNIMDEITGEFIMDTYEVTAKQMTNYLNSQRDTIFQEELEKRLPSGGELKAQIIQETIDCNNRSNSEYYAEDYCEGFKYGTEWLIQYLKK